MIADLVAELRAHRSRQWSLARLRPEALVFATSSGLSVERTDVLRAVYTAGDAAKLNPPGLPKVGCHSLRHFCAGLLLSARVPVPRAAAVLRHAHTRTLLATYAGLEESERAELRSDLEAAFR